MIQSNAFRITFITSVMVPIILTMIYNRSFIKTNNCSCDHYLARYNNDYILRKPIFQCRVSTSNMVDNGEFYTTLKNNFVIYCNDEINVYEKPKIYADCKYVSKEVCSIYLRFKLISNLILSYIIIFLVKDQILLLLSVIHFFLLKIFKTLKKQCKYCKLEYFTFHNCLRDFQIDTKSAFMVFIIIIHLCIYKVNADLSHSTINTAHGSIVTIKDLPGLNNRFQYDRHELNIVLKSTHVVHSVTILHKVVKIKEPVVEEHNSVCESNIEDCKLKSGYEPDYQYSKPRDNFSCLLKQLKVCFICTNKYDVVGQVVKVTKSDLKIDYTSYLNGEVNNNVVKVDIRNYMQVKRSVLFLGLNKEVYAGNICQHKDDSCWGKNTIDNNGKLDLDKDIKITDRSGESFILNQCAKMEYSYDKVLEKIDAQYLEWSIVENINLGYISFAINKAVIPKSDDCLGKVNIDQIEANGCYGCPEGYNLKFKTSCKYCCNVTCEINNEPVNIIINSKEFIYHGYSSTQNLEVSCPSFDKIFKLDEYSLDTKIHYSQEVVLDPERHLLDFNFGLSDIFMNFKVILIKIVVVILLSFSLYITSYAFKLKRYLSLDERLHIAKYKNM